MDTAWQIPFGRALHAWGSFLLLVGALGVLACNPTAAPDAAAAPVAQSLAGLADDTGPAGAVLAVVAAEGRAFLERIPRGQEAGYGFDRRAAFRRAEAGAPWAMVTLAEADLRASPDALILHPVNAWRVPVVVDGRVRCLWTVARVDGALHVVEVGAVGLAGELAELEARAVAGRAGLERRLLRLFPLRSDLALLSPGPGSAPEIYPLESARRFLPLAPGRTGAQRLGAAELIALLGPAFARSGGEP